MKNNSAQKKSHGVSETRTSESEDIKKSKGVNKSMETDLIPHHKAELAVEAEKLRERFLFIIEMWAADRYRYEWLENRTGIPAARWQNVLLEKQFPTLEMLIIVCKHQPNYTYWLMHGAHKHKLSENENHPWLKSECPSEEIFNKFKADREWIKQKRKSKMKAK